MTDLVLAIRLTADGKNLVGEVRGSAEELKKLGAAARESNDQGRASADRFTQSLTAVRAAAGLTGAAIGAALVGGLKASVTEAAASEQAHLKLEAVLRATGNAAGFTKAQLDAEAEALKRRTGIDDDAIRSSMAVLLTFRQVRGETFKETMAMAADLSKLMGQDLQSSVLMLGKALEDPESGLTALRRAGVSFNDEQKETIKNMVEFGDQSRALKMILQTMREQGIDGVAQAMNTGYVGAFNRATNAYSDLLKAIGNTSTVRGPVIAFFDELAGQLDRLKGTIESGSWMETLTRLNPLMWPVAGLVSGASGGGSPPAGGGGPAATAGGATDSPGWVKVMADQQKEIDKILNKAFDERTEREKRLLAESQKGWVALAETVFAEADRENLALARIDETQNRAAEEAARRRSEAQYAFEEGVAQKAANIQLENMTELELMQGQFEEKQIVIEQAVALERMTREEADRQLELLELQHQAKLGNATAQGMLQRRNIEQMGMRQQAEFYFGTLQQITAGAAQHNRTMFFLNKVAGIANATMSTFTGATKALEWGWPLGPIFAGMITAAGIANVAAISQTQLGGGTSAPSIAYGQAVPVTPAIGAPAVSTTPAAEPAARAAPELRKQIDINVYGGRRSVDVEELREIARGIEGEVGYGVTINVNQMS